MRNENVLYMILSIYNCCYTAVSYQHHIYCTYILKHMYICSKNVTQKHKSENTIKQDENLHPNMT